MTKDQVEDKLSEYELNGLEFAFHADTGTIIGISNRFWWQNHPKINFPNSKINTIEALEQFIVLIGARKKKNQIYLTGNESWNESMQKINNMIEKVEKLNG